MTEDLRDPAYQRAIVNGLMADPLAQRYAQRLLSSAKGVVRSADDVLGERIFRLGGILVLELERPGYVAAGAPPAEMESFERYAHIVRGCLKASPYLWSEKVRAVMRGTEARLPRVRLSPTLLPEPRSWHTLEVSINLGGTLEYEGRTYVDHTVDAFALMAIVPEGFRFYDFGVMYDQETRQERPCVGSAFFRYGTIYPDDYEGDDRRVTLESIMAFCGFLASPYIPTEREQASRGARREYVRAGLAAPTQDVTFVTLRRPEPKRGRETTDAGGVEWQHQWLVSGHYRAQWHPREQAHRVIWIAPYLKGPPDKPMLQHVYRVAR